MVIPVAPPFNEYAEAVRARLREQGIRVDIDVGEDRMNAKIRNAQNSKIPYMLIVGEKEEQNGTVSIRPRKGSQMQDLSLDEAIAFIQKKIKNKEEL
jgi:threonyl-tRNA synthetase